MRDFLRYLEDRRNRTEGLSLTNCYEFSQTLPDPSRPNFHNFRQISQFRPNFTILEYLEYLEYLELGQFRNFYDVLCWRYSEAKPTCNALTAHPLKYHIHQIGFNWYLAISIKPGRWQGSEGREVAWGWVRSPHNCWKINHVNIIIVTLSNIIINKLQKLQDALGETGETGDTGEIGDTGDIGDTEETGDTREGLTGLTGLRDNSFRTGSQWDPSKMGKISSN